MIESAAEFNKALDELAYTLARVSPDRALDVLARLLMTANDERWNLTQAPRLLDVAAGPTLCRPVGEPVTIVMADDYENPLP